MNFIPLTNHQSNKYEYLTPRIHQSFTIREMHAIFRTWYKQGWYKRPATRECLPHQIFKTSQDFIKNRTHKKKKSHVTFGHWVTSSEKQTKT